MSLLVPSWRGARCTAMSLARNPQGSSRGHQFTNRIIGKPEHVRNWFAPFEDKMTVCSIDLRVGGKYHMVFVTDDGTECSFRGTYLEIERPTRIVDTWLFEGWPDAKAVETVDLHETDGVTKVKMNLAFRDQAGRDHMDTTDGQEDSWNKMEDYLRSLAASGTVSGT